MRNRIKIILLPAIIVLLVSCTGSYLGRYIIWNYPKANDYKNMPYQTIKKSSEEFKFAKKIDESVFADIDLTYKNKNFKGRMDEYLEAAGTNAFVVIKNDTIVYERYFNRYSDSTIGRSFSVTKSFLSSLIGIAIENRQIRSVDDKIADYIPEINSEKYNDITIKSLLNMNSGFTSQQNFMPWSDLPKTYHAPNIRELTLHNLKKVRLAGTQFEYNNYNTFLLGMILENATHKSISRFLEENLWSQIGTTHNALFSIDSKKNNFEKVETGISATALDLAKFGRLYLNNGVWNGKQIIPKDWVNFSSSIDTSLVEKQEYYSPWMKKNKITYRNAWWQKYDGNYYCNTYWASGFLGQFIWIHPQKNLIVVRMGKEKGGINWHSLLAKVINEL